MGSGTQEAIIPVHHTVYSMLGFPDGFVAGLSRGVVAISLNATFGRTALVALCDGDLRPRVRPREVPEPNADLR